MAARAPETVMAARGGRAGVSIVRGVATTDASESTPQRLAAIREQMKLLSDYL
jgi:hypothetical protein